MKYTGASSAQRVACALPLILLFCVFSTKTAAQVIPAPKDTVRLPADTVRKPADTLRVPRDTTLTLPLPLPPINPPVPRPRIRLGGDSLGMRLPPVLSRADRETYRQAVAQIEAARATAFQQNRRAIIEAVWGQVATSSFATSEPSTPFAAEEPKQPKTVASRAGDIIAEHTDLGLQLNGRMEFRGEKNQSAQCASGAFIDPVFNCRSAFEPLLDFQFNARSGGVVAERVHVDVDYDTQREFDASNNISINYEGRGKEFVQRLEIGNVTFQPPVSRFITAGIPSGNYGVQAITQVGPARVKTIFAQQKGNIVSDRVFTVGDQTLQAVDRLIEDHQFEPRRFFFTVPPKLFGAAYPNIDILDSRRMAALAASLPDTLRPTKIFLYRLLIGGQPPNPSGPQFRIIGDPRSRRGQVYERLREGVDYYVDPSQLWIALVRPLSLNNERLVVAYRVNIAGRDTVNVTTGGTPDLEFQAQREQFANLLWDPQVTPEEPAFEREIRSVYRIGGPEVQRQSVIMKIATGTGADQEKANDPTGTAATFLQLFGLAQKTNSSTFDLENRLWPRPSDPNFELSLGASAARVIRDQFLVFPSLRPFATNGLAGRLNPTNDTIYTTPSEYVKSAQRPQSVYHIRARYQAQGSGEAGSLMLGAVQVRPNSERLLVDGIPLVRGTDYTVDYDLGRVSFARPDTLFRRQRQVTVQFEENPVFAETPTTIFGATAEIPMARGSVNFTAISQSQKTTFNRPPLGFEPAASVVAGVTAQFNFDASPLTSLVSHLPYGETTAPSRISVSGEFAASHPEPNSAGQAYLESFEGEGGLVVPLLDTQWYYSSQPALGRTFAQTFGAQSLDLGRASTLAWQSDGIDATARAVRYTIEQIDPLTTLAGTGISGPEQILWMTLYPLSIGGLRGGGDGNFKWNVGNTPAGRRWRSIRTALGPTGADLSRVENIEFWAQVSFSPTKRARNPVLVLDFGNVSENTVAYAPDTAMISLVDPSPLGRDTVYTGRQLQGFDRLDSERDPFSRAFNVGVNDNGLSGDVAGAITIVADTLPGLPAETKTVGNFATCKGGYSFIRILGDSRVDCTVGNNRLDEEDIDGDNVLNITSAEREQEELRRYIVNLADASKFNRVGRCSVAPRVVVGPPADSVCWVLFRIPFRTPDDSLGSPLLRRIRTVRITMLSSDQLPDADFSRVAIARLRLTGAPWIKRRDTGLRGVGGELPGSGFVNASVIGTQDRGLANGLSYESPPGVIDEPDTKQSNFETNRIQVNERSLRLTAGDLSAFDRAEAYFRFPEGEKNFMAYKELRLWARGVRNGWGDNGDLQFFVKIGRDPNNFYLYRTPLNGGPNRDAWLPEIRVDFHKLFTLRAEIQNAYLKGTARNSCTGLDSALIANTPVPSSGVRYVACSDGYIAYTSDPGVSPPNLAAVQELAVGMVRTGVGGSARPIAPGDTLELWVDDIRLGGVVDAAGFAGQVNMTVLASDFADIRMNLSRRDPNFRQLGEQPTFLTDNSVNVSSAFHLEKLLPRSFGLAIPFTINYTSASIEPLFVSQSDVEGDIVDGLRTPRTSATSLTFAIARATPLRSSRLAALWNNLSLSGSYTSAAARSEYEDGRAHNLTVGLDYNLSRALLPTLSRWAPAELHLTSVYTNGSDRRSAFLKPAFAADDVPQRINGLTTSWRNGTSLQLRPTKSVTGRLDFTSVRDLRGYGLNSPLGIVATADRDRILGADAGLERERDLQAGFNFTPTISTWIKPRLDIGSTYNMLRDPNALGFERQSDTTQALRLPLRLGSSQTTTARLTIDLPRAARLHLDSTTMLHRLFSAIQPIDINYNRSIVSVFEGTPISPPLSYQLAFGGIGSFRELRGHPATSAGIIRQLSATHTILLPFGASIANRYQLINARNWTRRADDRQAVTDGTQIVFPDVSVRWSMKPDHLRRLIASIGGSARAVQTRQINSRQPEFATVNPATVDLLLDPSIGADRGETVVTSYPANVAIVFAGSRPLSTSLGYSLSRRRESRPGLSAKSGDADVNVEISKPWALPPSWKPRSDLRTRLSYQDTHGDNFVLNPLAVSRESRLSDNGRRALSFSADTDVSENFTSSFVVSRVESFDKNLNRRFTQTVLSAVLHLNFFAGEMK